jgi:hypothetical protein
MIRSVESFCVCKDETDICDELISAVIAGIVRVDIRFGGIGGGQLPLDGREVHWISYGRWIVRNIKSNGVID